MLKHSSPVVNSVIRSERHPKNSDATIYFFVGFTTSCHHSSKRLLKLQLEENIGSLRLAMELTTKNPGIYTPYKYFTRTTMSLAELTALYPDGVFHNHDSDIKVGLGAFVLHKKNIWRSSYRSVSDLSTAKECASERILCFIVRTDHEERNQKVHEQANFVIETFKAHPTSGKYLQGLAVYKNIQSDDHMHHCPDTIIEFAIQPKTGKYFVPLLETFISSCQEVKIVFGVYKRKHILGDVEWV